MRGYLRKGDEKEEEEETMIRHGVAFLEREEEETVDVDSESGSLSLCMKGEANSMRIGLLLTAGWGIRDS